MTLFQMEEADYGDEIQHAFCLPAIFGCTDPEACNFNEEANTDNGLCEVPGDACDDGDEDTVFDVIGEDCMCAGVPAVLGCTDDEACNYDEAANVDDGSCYTLGSGTITGPLFPFAGDTATYTYNGATGDSFEWSVTGGEIVEGQGSNVLTVVWGEVSGSGAVFVVESDASGCEGEVVRTVQILEATSVAGLEMLTLSVMPNPARDWILLDWGANGDQQADIVVYDVRGAEVLRAVSSGPGVLRRIGPRSLHLEGAGGFRSSDLAFGHSMTASNGMTSARAGRKAGPFFYLQLGCCPQPAQASNWARRSKHWASVQSRTWQRKASASVV